MNKLFLSNEAISIAVCNFLKLIIILGVKLVFKYYSLNCLSNVYPNVLGLNNIYFEKLSHTNVQNEQSGFGRKLQACKDHLPNVLKYWDT